MDPANVSLTLWHKDEQDDAPPLNAPEAQGVAINVNVRSGDNLLWFVRGGWSDGRAIERNLTAGLGWPPDAHHPLTCDVLHGPEVDLRTHPPYASDPGCSWKPLSRSSGCISHPTSG
jgi:hypothetical protein